MKRGCQLIYGPMMSGKSSRLMFEISVYSKFVKVLLITCELDERELNVAQIGNNKSFITTHNNIFRNLSDNVDCVRSKIDQLENIDFLNYDVIAIDEAQFYPGLNKIVRNWVNNHGKFVLVCGLVGDYKNNQFGEMLNLIPFCDFNPIILTAKCKECVDNDGTIKKAHFTKKYTDVEFENTVDIGGSEKYYPVCRSHQKFK